jgi:ankyrin repeat protein
MPLQIAMDVNNVTQIKNLTKHRNDVNVEADGVPALTTAARLGQIDTIKFMIDNGADVNFGGKLNCTPLMAAASRIDIPMMEMLLSYGADPNVTDDWGRTLLHRAFYSMKCDELVEGIKFMLAIGMDIEAQDKYGQTPLHLAAEHCPTALQLLLNYGANVNARTRAGQTPLHLAAGKYSQAKARALLDAGADVNVKTPDGLTPLYKVLARCAAESARQRQRETAEILLQHGAKVDARIIYEKGKAPPDHGCLWKTANDKERQQEQLMIELLEKYSANNQ